MKLITKFNSKCSLEDLLLPSPDVVIRIGFTVFAQLGGSAVVSQILPITFNSNGLNSVKPHFLHIRYQSVIPSFTKPFRIALTSNRGHPLRSGLAVVIAVPSQLARSSSHAPPSSLLNLSSRVWLATVVPGL